MAKHGQFLLLFILFISAVGCYYCAFSKEPPEGKGQSKLKTTTRNLKGSTRFLHQGSDDNSNYEAHNDNDSSEAEDDSDSIKTLLGSSGSSGSNDINSSYEPQSDDDSNSSYETQSDSETLVNRSGYYLYDPITGQLSEWIADSSEDDHSDNNEVIDRSSNHSNNNDNDNDNDNDVIDRSSHESTSSGSGSTWDTVSIDYISDSYRDSDSDNDNDRGVSIYSDYYTDYYSREICETRDCNIKNDPQCSDVFVFCGPCDVHAGFCTFGPPPPEGVPEAELESTQDDGGGIFSLFPMDPTEESCVIKKCYVVNDPYCDYQGCGPCNFDTNLDFGRCT